MSSFRKALLQRAREIIGNPTCWTQWASARDHLSRSVSPRSTEAQRFCAFGALMRASHEQGLSDRWMLEFFNAPSLTRLVRTNDADGYEAALDCLKRLEGEG